MTNMILAWLIRFLLNRFVNVIGEKLRTLLMSVNFVFIKESAFENHRSSNEVEEITRL